MKARKTGFIALAVALAAAAVTLVITAAPSAGPVRKHQPQATIKAAWIYVGPHNDGGWSQAHDKGRLFAQKALGSAVETTFKENVPEGPQTCQVIESLVRDGNKIIFATSFGFQACMVSEAKKHPDVYFEQATYYHRYTVDIYLHALLLARLGGRQVPPAMTERLANVWRRS